MKFTGKLIACMLKIGLQSCSNADQKGADTSQKSNLMSDTAKSMQVVSGEGNLDDQAKVVVIGAATGMMEVEAAGMALKKSKDQALKDFADSMLKDHNMANQELKKIARGKGVELAKTLPEKEAGHLTEMNTLADRAFDVQYMRMMINDHQKTVQLFTDGSHLADPDLRAFAVKTLPVIKQHYQNRGRYW